jgi:UPF0271 protein
MIDLNCDMGESFGAYALGADEALMPLVTSANIACGYHAGDPMVMDRTVRLALRYGVGIGAHPGFPDLMGFGRRAMHLRTEEIENYVLYQVGALEAFARSVGAELIHVKPHGALYNMAARDPAIAQAVARGVARAGPHRILVGLAGSALIQAAAEVGLSAAREGFADRAYLPDGALAPRHLPGAVIKDPEQAADQAVSIALRREVRTVDGQVIPLVADTLCIHGDTPGAVEIARAVRRRLEDVGVEVIPMGKFLPSARRD